MFSCPRVSPSELAKLDAAEAVGKTVAGAPSVAHDIFMRCEPA